MFRDLLSSRWFQAGLAFFVIVVGGSLLYSWHAQRTTEADFGKRRQPGVSIENKPSTNTAPADFQTEGVTNTPDANTYTPISEKTETETIDATEFSDIADAFLLDDVAIEEPPAEDVAVSPYGFGPYPELPPEWEGAFPPVSVKHELMVRVAVKLREQGVNVEGTSMEDGYVFPTIKGIHYVKWKVNQEGIRYISERTGHPADGDRIYELQIEKGEPLTESDIPSDIQLVSYEEGRIDPYDFLGLQR